MLFLFCNYFFHVVNCIHISVAFGLFIPSDCTVSQLGSAVALAFSVSPLINYISSLYTRIAYVYLTL